MVLSLALGLVYIGLAVPVGLGLGAIPLTDLQGRMFSMMPQSVVRFSAPGSPQEQDIYGFTVCLRMIPESARFQYSYTILTLTMSNRVIFSLAPSYSQYRLQVDAYRDKSKTFSPVVPVFWSNFYPWTSLCATWDNATGMTQMFKDGHMSVRKGMSRSQNFSGTLVVTLSNFEGQVTDIHVWDKALPLSDLRNYNQGDSWDTFHGNLLSWRDINYTYEGYAVLEDAYPRMWGGAEKGHTGKKRRQHQRGKHGQQRSKCRPGGSSQ